MIGCNARSGTFWETVQFFLRNPLQDDSEPLRAEFFVESAGPSGPRWLHAIGYYVSVDDEEIVFEDGLRIRLVDVVGVRLSS